MDPMLQKVIMWMLGGLVLVMTTIGGSTASRLINQLDNLVTTVNTMQISSAVSDTKRISMELQLQEIQLQLERIEQQQTHQTTKRGN